MKELHSSQTFSSLSDPELFTTHLAWISLSSSSRLSRSRRSVSSCRFMNLILSRLLLISFTPLDLPDILIETTLVKKRRTKINKGKKKLSMKNSRTVITAETGTQV
jgi:hypothetical protein